MTVIHVGTQPPTYTTSAIYLDGQTAKPHPVALTLEDGHITITSIAPGTGVAERWNRTEIHAIPQANNSSTIVLLCDAHPMARLYLPNRIIETYLPNAHMPPAHLHRPRMRRRIFGWGGAAIAMVALLLSVVVPALSDRLAPLLPPAGERALGDAVLDQMRTSLDSGDDLVAFCMNQQGQAALRTMTARLNDAADPAVDVRVAVLDHPMVNAFALPGGQIILFRGFIDQSGSAEEVAAVLAHEIGHTARRDPTRSALRWGGSLGVLGLLFGDFAGGTVSVFLVNQLITSRHSRTAEAEADAYALDLLARADIRPSALADFFDRMQAMRGTAPDQGALGHFSSHPDDTTRADAARAATPTGYTGRPVISPAEWRDLQNICD
ncbi:MAG: M48 family metallopeptidase [Paracoccaceae bacterium]